MEVNSTDKDVHDPQTPTVSCLAWGDLLLIRFLGREGIFFSESKRCPNRRDRKLQFFTVMVAALWKLALVQAEVLTLWIAKVLKPAFLQEILLKGSRLQQKSIRCKSKRTIPLRSNAGLLLASKVQHRGNATWNTSELPLKVLLIFHVWCASLKRVEVIYSIHCMSVVSRLQAPSQKTPSSLHCPPPPT